MLVLSEEQQKRKKSMWCRLAPHNTARQNESDETERLKRRRTLEGGGKGERLALALAFLLSSLFCLTERFTIKAKFLVWEKNIACTCAKVCAPFWGESIFFIYSRNLLIVQD